jgi:hypothetical protein
MRSSPRRDGTHSVLGRVGEVVVEDVVMDRVVEVFGVGVVGDEVVVVGDEEGVVVATVVDGTVVHVVTSRIGVDDGVRVVDVGFTVVVATITR